MRRKVSGFVTNLVMISFLVGTGSAVQADEQNSVSNPPTHDEFYWLGQINKASTVMLVEQGIVSQSLARTIARAIVQVNLDSDAPGATRPGVDQYLKLEAMMVQAGGPEVTRVHSGRSRQDLLATVNRIRIRERSMQLASNVELVEAHLLDTAALNVDTIIPAYTNGVQAQPTTLGHYLLAFASALRRDDERLAQSYTRINLSPLGAAALGTSSFAIDRKRLANLLGFSGVIDNSYDANLIASMDGPLEPQQTAVSIALTVSALIEDIAAQYREVYPWLLLREGALTGPSSIMPQKRNPYGLGRVRALASQVVSDEAAFVVAAHNLAPGMLDYKNGSAEKTLDDATQMLQELDRVISALVVDRNRALAEVESDYSMTTELADILQRDCNIPFRIGHYFASQLVTYGRGHNLKPSEFPYSEAQRIFALSATEKKWPTTVLPLSEPEFRKALSARNMVESSRGLGGPQVAEFNRMLQEERAGIALRAKGWSAQQLQLQEATDLLQRDFDRIDAR